MKIGKYICGFCFTIASLIFMASGHEIYGAGEIIAAGIIFAYL